MNQSSSIIFVLLLYKAVLIGFGIWASRRTHDTADYLLGGRKLGPWVAAISASASSSSAWTLLGVSGAAYLYGLSAIWLLPATLSGFLINWILIAPRLASHSRKINALTLTDVLATDDELQSSMSLRWISSLVILFCFVFYIASQFDAAGQSFQSVFGLEKQTSILFGAGIILLYTLLGGFWAVSLTDTFQGIMMALASFILPLVAFLSVGPVALWEMLSSQSALLSPSGAGGILALGYILGTLGIGIGYPGQPHVVNRFMAIEESNTSESGASGSSASGTSNSLNIQKARKIAIGWACIIYPGMIVLGWSGRLLLDIPAHEQILIEMSTALFPPIVSGIILAAVLSAIMSTADSQLLVASSSVSHDLRKGDKEWSVFQTRIAVVVICALSVAMALFVDKSIYSRVLFAFSAMGSAFGPLLIGRLQGGVRSGYAIAAVLAGFLLTLFFYYLPFQSEGSPLERLVPFVASFGIVQLGRRRM